MSSTNNQSDSSLDYTYAMFGGMEPVLSFMDSYGHLRIRLLTAVAIEDFHIYYISE